MTRARGGALVAVLIVAAAGILLTLAAQRRTVPEAKPVLMLLTSLPLVFGEEFGAEHTGSPALSTLSKRFVVNPISTSSAAELAKGKLLLMAQPPAQAPENLVALDAWVRRGGRVMLLADPLLEWPSRRALGDPLRPPVMFTDTGLLGHWGLRLDAPDERREARRKLGRMPVMTHSPGTLTGRCEISPDGLVADCRIGRGRAFVIADADLLNVGKGKEGTPNLDSVVATLAQLPTR